MKFAGPRSGLLHLGRWFIHRRVTEANPRSRTGMNPVPKMFLIALLAVACGPAVAPRSLGELEAIVDSARAERAETVAAEAWSEGMRYLRLSREALAAWRGAEGAYAAGAAIDERMANPLCFKGLRSSIEGQAFANPAEVDAYAGLSEADRFLFGFKFYKV